MNRAFIVLLLALPVIVFAQDAGAMADAGIQDAGMQLVADAGVSIQPVGDALVSVAPPSVPNLDGDLVGFLKQVHSSVLGKEWGKLIFFVITFLVWVSRKFFSKRLPWLGSSMASVIKSFLLAFSGMLATTWPAGGRPEAADVFTAFQMGFAAAGGWSILKALLEAGTKKGWGWVAWLHDVIVGKKAAAKPVSPA